MNLSGAVKINKCGVIILSFCLVIVFYYLFFNNSTGSRHYRPYGFIMRNPNEINLRKLLIGGIQVSIILMIVHIVLKNGNLFFILF